MKENDSNNLTQGPIWEKLLHYFIPIAAGTLLQQLYNAADAVIVGKFVGTEALAAVGGSASTLTSTIVNLFVSLSCGAAVIISQLYGREEKELLSKAAHTATVFSAVSGFLFGAVGIIFTPQMLSAMHTPSDTLAQSTLYMKIYFSGLAFTLLFDMGSGILRAVGDSKSPFRVLAISCAANIVLDLIFVGFLSWGVAGAAAATVVSQMICCIAVFRILFKSEEAYGLSVKKMKIDFPLLSRMMKIGIPAAMQSAMYGFSNLYVQRGFNVLGTVNVAAWSLSGKLDGFYWSIISAAGIAVMNFVGQNYGAGRYDRVNESTRISMKRFMAITIAFSVVILIVKDWVFGFFIDDPAVIEATIKVVAYFVPYYFLWTIIELLSGVLKGVGNSLAPTVITGIGIVVFRVLWVALLFKKHTTLFVISMSYPASWLVTGIAMILYFKFGNWQNKEMNYE